MPNLRYIIEKRAKNNAEMRRKMTAENLCVLLNDMQKETEKQKIKWRLEMATSEYIEASKKPVIEADGKTWSVDECFTSYSCEFRGSDFCMISYENIERSGDEERTTNLVFIPPIAMRIFKLDELAPYALETSALLADKVHRLWETLLEFYREKKSCVDLDVREISVATKSDDEPDEEV